MISMDVIIKPNINRVWPNFKWYDGRPSIIFKMKSLTETYKIERNVKVRRILFNKSLIVILFISSLHQSTMKIVVLGPPASGKTKLAHKLARYYSLVYLEPNEIVQNHIDKVVSFILFFFFL